jgi:signal peptidase I
VTVMLSLGRFSLIGLRSLALGVVIGLVLVVGAPLLTGSRSFTVLSGSMEPAISAGDVVVDEPIPVHAARAGDVVTFPSPENAERLITHRVQSVAPGGRRLNFITRGDANSGTESWSAPADGRIGRVVYTLPKMGYALNWARSPQGTLILVTVPALLLCGWALVRIWRPRSCAA